MSIEVTIKPEDIDALVRDAIMKSSFGKLIDDTIKTVTKAGSYNNPIENAIKEFYSQQALKVLNEVMRDRIVESIRASLSEKLTDEWIKEKADVLAYKLIRES